MEVLPSARKARLYLLKLRSWSSACLLRKRDLSKNIYIFKKQFHSRHFSGSADRECVRPSASALKARGEKTHGRFPLVAPLFPSRLFPQRQNAAHAITAGRKKQRSATTKDAEQKKQTATPVSIAHSQRLWRWGVLLLTLPWHRE